MTKVIDLHQAKIRKGLSEEVITIEKVSKYSNDDLLSHLQEAIDWLSQEDLYSEGWNGLRDHIDDIVAILDERLAN